MKKEIGFYDLWKLITGPLAPAVLVVIGACLRFYGIGINRMWYDESYTLLLSRMPLTQLISATAGDVHPPLYYLITWLILRLTPFMPEVYALRGFSALLSTVTLIVLYRVALRAGLARGARLVALAWMVFASFQIQYAQETRMYALIGLLVLCALWAILARRWVWLALLLALLLWSHNYGLYYGATLGLIAIVQEIRKPVHVPADEDQTQTSQTRAVIGAGVVAVGSYLPWLSNLIWQAGKVQEAYWIRPFNIGSFGMGLNHLLLGSTSTDWATIPLLALAIGGLFLVLIHGVQARRLSLLLLAVLPCLLSIGVSVLWQPTFLPRGLIGSLPAVYLLGGAAVAGAGRLGRAYGYALGVLLLVFCTGPYLIENYAGRGKEWENLTNSMPYSPGATVIHANEFTYVEFMVYHPEANHLLLDIGCPPEAGALTQQTRDAIGIKTVAALPTGGTWYYAAMLTPTSTACHERAFITTDALTERVQFYKNPVGYYGIGVHP